MRFPLVAAAIVALLLITCSGPKSTTETDPEVTRVEIPEVTTPSPSDASLTRKSLENTLVETPGYTGVIISENGASEFSYVFDNATTF